MHRFARFGGRDGIPDFRRELDRHATFLGMVARHGEPVEAGGSVWIESRIVPASRSAPADGREGGGVAAPPGPDAPDGGGRGNRVRVRLDSDRAVLRIEVPLAAVEPCYWTADARGLVIGNDLRLMTRWAGHESDPRGLAALRQYGAVPAPFTLSRRVQRAPPGHLLDLSTADPPAGRVVSLRPDPEILRPDASPASFERFLQPLDRHLGALPGPLVLLFSGGVDSGLIATRLARIGRRDVTLVNFSFGDGDGESALAESMATRLGFPFRRVAFDLSGLEGLLGRLGRLYSFPFCDLSLIPTALLVEGALDQVGAACVVDGTGADGAFGVGARQASWAGWYRVPRWVRLLGGAVYSSGRLWLWDSASRLERLGRVARRSARMPLVHAGVLATNSLCGIAFDGDPQLEGEVRGALDRYLGALTEGKDPPTALSLADLVHVCAGIYAAKSFDPVRGRGSEPIYPYLDPPALRAALALPWAEKCRDGEPKAILKECLAREVPREMVYRPKSGFLPPFRTILAHPAMQDFLRTELLSGRSAYEGAWRRPVIQTMLDRGARGEPLSQGAWNLLWTLGFASAWFRQIRPGSNP